ncbi:MAG TPA: IS1595 family transposase [Pyrinomonadaceae bacterium]|nr:IS1595 family transposase [Pyrinomonadaceae bacterium]
MDSCRCWSNGFVSSLLHEPPYTEPYVRWCGRTAGATPPPTRFDPLRTFSSPATGVQSSIFCLRVSKPQTFRASCKTLFSFSPRFQPKHVEAGSKVYSDALRSYNQLSENYVHNVINHAEEYVRGNIHTNGIENFWSLLKRTLGGTYVSVEPFHLFRYLDEQSYRFNNRKLTDAERFLIATTQIVDRRVTYKELTGKDDSRQPA